MNHYCIKAKNLTRGIEIYKYDSFHGTGCEGIDLDDLVIFIFNEGRLADPYMRGHYFNYPESDDIRIEYIKTSYGSIIYKEDLNCPLD